MDDKSILSFISKRYNMHVQKNVYICVYIYVALKCKTNLANLMLTFKLYDPGAVMHLSFFYMYWQDAILSAYLLWSLNEETHNISYMHSLDKFNAYFLAPIIIK